MPLKSWGFARYAGGGNGSAPGQEPATSGVALIHDAELSPTKEATAARYGGMVTLFGGYRLVEPDDQVGIEVLVGSDLDGRTVQLPLTYRGAELDPAHTLTEMEHSVLGRRWVSNALGGPVAVTQIIRTILEGDDGAARSDGVPPALSIRSSGDAVAAGLSGVMLREVTCQRATGMLLLDGRVRPFQLLMPRLLRRLNLTGVDANTSRLHLAGWLPALPEKRRVAAELNIHD